MNLTRVLYFTTSTVIDWVDIFTRPSYKHVIVDSLSYCQSHKGLTIYAWVLMSNHLHMIVDTNDDTTVGDVLRDFKKFTNKKILKALEQDEHESRREWLLDRFAEIVAKPEDYLYSSALNYAGEKGLLNVELIS